MNARRAVVVTRPGSPSLPRVAPLAGPSAVPAPLEVGLDRVHGALLEAVAAEDPFLTEVAGHLINAGGKRQRPAFAMAAALIGAPGATEVTRESMLGGVSCELVHLGSLYHDDVMDEATTRHFVESVNARWGNLQAILAGDYLLAKASEIAAGLGTEVAGLLAATIARLCEGQVAELRDAFNPGRTEERYFRSIAGKTAALFATSCRIGAIVGDLPRAQVETLTTFGREYGMAFQIADDVLDVVASDEELGKPSGHDMVEGTYNLPVLRVLAGSDGTGLKELLGSPLDDEQRLAARDLVRADPDAVRSSVADARRHADQAIAALGDLATTEAGGWMVGTTQHLLAKVTSHL
jgi:heptaprenyl diphosphate synthase